MQIIKTKPPLFETCSQFVALRPTQAGIKQRTFQITFNPRNKGKGVNITKPLYLGSGDTEICMC